MNRRFRLLLLSFLGLAVLAACGTPQPPTVEHELTVAVAGDGSGSVTSDPEGIDTADGDFTATFTSGTLITLTASADEGSTFAGFTFPDDPDRTCDAGGATNSCIITLDESVNVTATFTEAVDETQDLNVTVAGAGSGSVTSDPEGIDTADGGFTATFTSGTLITLTASADEGSTFSGFTFPDDTDRACEEGSTDTTCLITLDENVNVTATFTEAPPPTAELTVNVEVAGAAAGSVVSDPAGIDTAAGEDVAPFTSGTLVTLTASAEEGSTFSGFTFPDDTDRACEEGSTDTTCIFTLDESVNVTAAFAEAPAPTAGELTVNVEAGGAAAGSVLSDPAGIDTASAANVATFEVGSSVTLTATATEGGFAGWTGGACDGSTSATCTFTMRETEAPITANFNDIETLVVRVNANSDDAEEFLKASLQNATRWPAGYTYIRSDDLELGYDPQHGPQAIGLRFVDITIPEGANVLDAFIGFTAFRNLSATVPGTGSEGNVVLTITAEASPAPATFIDDPNASGANEPSSGVTSLVRTDASAAWTISDAWVTESTYQTSDVGAIVQEIIDLDGWLSGNAMKFVIEPDDIDSTEWRRAYAHNSDSSKAAALTVQFVRLP